MARNGVTKLYTAIPGGGTQGTDLRTWMAANLTELTVGAMYAYGAGVSERNYWTLTFPASGAEILVCCPNGTNMYRDNLYYDLDTIESSWQQPLVLVYSVDGGFEAALVATHDPDTVAFYNHIVTTLGYRAPTKGIPLLYWRAGSGVNHQLHVIEDDNQKTIIFTLSQSGGINGANYMSTYIASDEMYVLYPSADPLLSTEGVLYLCSNNVAGPNKTYRYLRAYGYQYGGGVMRSTEPALNTLPWDGNMAPALDPIGSGRYPFTIPANKDWAAELWVDLADVYWARCNPNLVRLTGVNNPRFNLSQGDDADHEFIKHIQRFLTPWDQAQTPPT